MRKQEAHYNRGQRSPGSELVCVERAGFLSPQHTHYLPAEFGLGCGSGTGYYPREAVRVFGMPGCLFT